MVSHRYQQEVSTVFAEFGLEVLIHRFTPSMLMNKTITGSAGIEKYFIETGFFDWSTLPRGANITKTCFAIKSTSVTETQVSFTYPLHKEEKRMNIRNSSRFNLAEYVDPLHTYKLYPHSPDRRGVKNWGKYLALWVCKDSLFLFNCDDSSLIKALGSRTNQAFEEKRSQCLTEPETPFSRQSVLFSPRGSTEHHGSSERLDEVARLSRNVKRILTPKDSDRN